MPAITPGMVPAQGPGQSKFFELPAQHMFQALANKQAEYDVQATELMNLGDFADAAKIHQSYTDGFGVITNDIDNAINELSSGQIDLSSPEGVRAVEQLRRTVRSIYGANGPIGKMMAATNAYDEKVKNLQETYKDNPEWLQSYIKALKPIDLDIKSLTGSIDGSLTEQPLPELKKVTMERFNMGMAQALDIAGVNGTTNFDIEEIGDIYKGISTNKLTVKDAADILVSMRNTLTSTTEVMGSFTMDAYTELDRDPSNDHLSVDEKWNLAKDGAKAKINDILFSQATASAGKIHDGSIQSLWNAFTKDPDDKTSSPNTPQRILTPSPDEIDDKISKKEITETTGVTVENGQFVPPPTLEEYIQNIEASEALAKENAKRDPVGRLNDQSIYPSNWDENDVIQYEVNKQKFLEEKYQKEHGQDIIKYNNVKNKLTKNGLTFESDQLAFQFIQDNFTQLSRQDFAYQIIPSSESGSPNVDAFSSNLQSQLNAIAFDANKLVTNADNPNIDPQPLWKLVKDQFGVTSSQAKNNIYYDSKKAVGISSDGQILVSLNYKSDSGKGGNIVVAVNDINPGLKNIMQPIQEYHKLIKSKTIKLDLSAGDRVAAGVLPYSLTTRDEDGNEISLNNARVEIVYVDPIKKEPLNGPHVILSNSEYPDGILISGSEYETLIQNYGIYYVQHGQK